jgi:hypothetical protein
MLVQDITTQDVLRVLQPLWLDKTETASRLRGRIEAVLSWATVAGHRTGDNPARWAGNLKELLPAPSKVESKPLATPVPGGYTAYSEYAVRFTYANGVVFNVRTTADDSPYGGVINKDGQRNGIRFEGTDGWLWVNRTQIEASERELLTTPLPDDAERLYFSNNHMQNFFECAASRKDPICPVEVGHQSASVCHLGTISLRTGKTLHWDYKRERFTGAHAAEANTYIAREMRKPYDYSFVA